MTTPKEYAARLDALGLEEVRVKAENVKEAKAAAAQLRIKKKELQNINREIAADMKIIRATYQAKIPAAGSTGGALLRGLGIGGVKGMKGAATSHQAAAKRKVKDQQARDLQPYEKLQNTIKNALAQIDIILAKIDSYILEESK